MSQVRISRQHWDNLLGELDLARRQRHLLTYRALIERLQLPSPAMQTLTAALEYLAVLDARAEQPLRSSLVISQGASRLPRTGFLSALNGWADFPGRSTAWKQPHGMPPRWSGCSSTAIPKRPDSLPVPASSRVNPLLQGTAQGSRCVVSLWEPACRR